MRSERLYHSLGILGLAAAFVLTIVASYGVITGVTDAGLAGGACAVTFLVPSVFFLFYSRERTALDDRLRQLADVLEGYRQINMDELAAKIGATQKEAELLVAACVGRGYVRGRIDPTSRTFAILPSDQAPERQETRT